MRRNIALKKLSPRRVNFSHKRLYNVRRSPTSCPCKPSSLVMTTNAAPITSKKLNVSLSGDTLELVHALRNAYGFRSNSDVLRFAVCRCKFAKIKISNPAGMHRISFRMPGRVRNAMLRAARDKRVSVGDIIRATLQALPEQPNTTTTHTQNQKIVMSSTKPISKKPAAPAKAAPAKKPVAPVKAAPAKKPAAPVKKPAPPAKAVPAKKPVVPAKAAPAKKPAAPAKKPVPAKAAPVKKPAAPAKAAPAKKPVAPVKKPAAPAKKPVPAPKPAPAKKPAPAPAKKGKK